MAENVLIVTSQPSVGDFLYKSFSEDSQLKNDFLIVDRAATRDRSLEIISEYGKKDKEDHIDIVLFFEYTAGSEDLTISKLLYKYRLHGARVIYVSTQRDIGDLVLETVVGYGVYDIILSKDISVNMLKSFFYYPREFKDVAIFHREVNVNDQADIKKGFIVPNLDELRRFSSTLEYDYAQDPAMKGLSNIKPKVNREEDDRTVSGSFFRTKKNKKKVETKRPVNKQPANKQKGLGDLTGY